MLQHRFTEYSGRMAFALIRPDSRPLIAAAESEYFRTADALRAVATLRSDFERWSRWAVGIAGFGLAVAGSFVTVGLLETVRLLGGSLAGVDLVLIVVAGVIALVGITVLLRLWWTGRQLLQATFRWTRSQAVRGVDVQRGVGGWLQARTVNLEPRVLVRLVSGTLALLIGVGAVALVIRDLLEGVTSFTVAAGVVGAIALSCGVGQTGGVMRIVSALAEADPLWTTIRSGIARR